VSADGRLVVSAGADGTVRIWDLANGEQLRALRGHSGAVGDCAVSPELSFVVSAGWDCTVRVWDPVSGNELRTLEGNPRELAARRTSPEEERRVSLRPDRDPRPPVACAVSPDASFLVSASDDRELRLWDVATGHELRRLRGHEAKAVGCAVGPDGSFVASVGLDRTLRLWAPATGAELAILPLPAASWCVAVDPRAARLLCGDVSGTLILVELHGIELGSPLVTAIDLGDGATVRCPACLAALPLVEEWRGREIACPQAGCGQAMRVSPLVARSPRLVPEAPEEPERQPTLDREKTCGQCGHRVEIARYACPNCGSLGFSFDSDEDVRLMEERQQRAASHVDAGARLFQRGDTEGAEAEFRRAEEINPSNAMVHGNLGMVMLQTGRPREAVREFERCLELDPRAPGAPEMLERAKAEAGR
jgi:RNA polymerase subunit RPABC4/transcription elongation factor Spt4